MHLTTPPIGLAAVKAMYLPVSLTEFTVICGTRLIRITAHEKAAPNIKAFFEIVQTRGLGELIKTFDGCYNNRPKRTNASQLSMHGYGAAFDIDASTNQQGTPGDMPQGIVDIGRLVGFFWGGDFKGDFRDAMHFQLGVDFALGGRPAPAITYQGEPAVPALPAPALPLVDPYRTVKMFDFSDGHMVGSAADSGIVLVDGHAYIRATALPAVLGDSTITAAVESGVIMLRRGTKPSVAVGL